MRRNPPGYPLPAGDLGEDDIVCQLVYLPDRPEYWQALFAAMHYFSTWLAWERDDDHRGQDAAANWREAFELTMECWRMTCLSSLTDRMDEIIDLISLNKPCCDDNITYGPGTEVTTDIEPEVGDPPDFYGETAVSDWDDWREHVCHNAHLYVDSLVSQAQDMDTLLELGAIQIGVVAAGLLLLSAVGLVIPVGFALVAATAAGIFGAGSLSIFLQTAQSIEDARDSIICALIQGDSLRDAVDDALESGLDWDLFFQFVDYESATAIVYEGGFGSEYLPAETRDDCDTCDYEQQGEEDLYINWQFVESHDYDEAEKEWTVVALSTGGCFQCGFQFWTDSGKTVKQLVKIVVSECNGTVKCGALNTTKGIADNSMVYEYDHPPLAHIDLAFIDDYRHLHEQPGTQYTIKFKLYL